MSNYLPPPTYAEVVLIDERTGKPKFNPIWLDWFVRMAASLSEGGASDHNELTNLQGGTTNQYYHLTAAQQALAAAYVHNSLNSIQGGGASERYHLTSAQHTLLTAYAHNSLNSIQGGAANDYYHITAAQRTALLTLLGITGISATITTAAITGGGATGSMTFVSGLLTAQTPAT